MTYSEKLKDPKWQKKRLQVLERDEFTCTLCWDDTATLNIHHLSYDKNPWDTHLDNLTTLCEPCHQIVENFKKGRPELVVVKILKIPFNKERLLQLCLCLNTSNSEIEFIIVSFEGKEIATSYYFKQEYLPVIIGFLSSIEKINNGTTKEEHS